MPKKPEYNYKWLKQIYFEIGKIVERLVSLEQFRFAMECHHCPECVQRGFSIVDFDDPITVHSDQGLCEKHEQKLQLLIKKVEEYHKKYKGYV